MPGRKKKSPPEPQTPQASNSTEEKENDSGFVKCSCPMKKHPNNSRTCNKKKNSQKSQNSKKIMDSDSDSDFEPESKVSMVLNHLQSRKNR